MSVERLSSGVVKLCWIWRGKTADLSFMCHHFSNYSNRG